MDSRFSIDTISEISQHEASPVTTSSPRTAFEQQLCTHLLNLSEVAETLADRVMALEARLAEVEKSQIADDDQDAISDDAGELLSASEEKVRLLRDRLAPAQVVALHAEDTSPRNLKVISTRGSKTSGWKTKRSVTTLRVTPSTSMTRRSTCAPLDRFSSAPVGGSGRQQPVWPSRAS